MTSTHTALCNGNYSAAVRALLRWNKLVMAGRKAGSWVTLTDDGRIDVRYRGLEHLLPNAEELPELWINSYFMNALKSICLQLGNAA